jgi:lysyl-tRNA synthetase class 1
MNLEDEIALMKGSPLTEADQAELRMRAMYAKKWLEQYAEDKFIFELQQSLPDVAITAEERAALTELADKISVTDELSGEVLHQLIHDVKESSGLTPKVFFSAIYKLFLGKDSGPKVGWFLSSLEKDFVIKRLRQEA